MVKICIGYFHNFFFKVPVNNIARKPYLLTLWTLLGNGDNLVLGGEDNGRGVVEAREGDSERDSLVMVRVAH